MGSGVTAPAASEVKSMSTLNPTEPACVKVRSLLDSYAGGGRDAAGAGEVRRHLEDCAACAALAAERERVRALVRRAVRSEPAPEALRAKVRELIRGDVG